MTKHIYCPIEVLTDTEITDSERKVLLALYSFRNANTELCCPSIEKIQERTNIKDYARIIKGKKGAPRKFNVTFEARNKMFDVIFLVLVYDKSVELTGKASSSE